MRADRIAEVIVDLPPPGGRRRGSGYLVASDKALTAAHVVADAAAIRVRFEADQPGERTSAATLAWVHPGIDVAVLVLSAAWDEAEALEVAEFGRVGDHGDAEKLHCTAAGFPWFKLRSSDEDGSTYRDCEQVHATCAPLSNRREGTLDLIVSPPAPRPGPDASPWEGMSGAVVFGGGRIIGVITEHHLSDGLGRLAASRVDRWAERLKTDELRALESLFSCDLTSDALPGVAPLSAPSLQEAYKEQLRELFAPEALEDRDDEIRQLTAFCRGAESYLWLQGPPWAGKTALAAWLALHPPPGIIPVHFFVSVRLLSQDDSAAYTEAVTDQLAAVVGRELASNTSLAARDRVREGLLKQAAERIARDDSTLLLIVDGLDEDQSGLPGHSGPSIASLLPERLPANVKVLVTSRHSPGVPRDVKGSHPLRQCRVQQLDPVEAASHSEYEATHELSRALSGEALGRRLVGLLAAARDPLPLQDLLHLTGQEQFAVKECLGGSLGRIMQSRGEGYMFAHETLLATALEALGPDLETHRQRIHAWAQRYADEGWPQSTPPYLLRPYGTMVATTGDVQRATALATDLRRRDRLREVTGGDGAGLAEIDAARAAVWRETPDDLGSLAALAAASDLLKRRNTALPRRLPAVLARSGETGRAVELARSNTDLLDRAYAVVGVAQVLANTGDEQAADLAWEAVQLAEPDDATKRAWPDYENVVGRAAVALMTAGQEHDACSLLAWFRGEVADEYQDSRDQPPAKMSVIGVVALAQASVPARRCNADLATQLVSEAVARAEHLDVTARIHALAAVAEACMTTDPVHAGRCHDRIARLAEDPGSETAELSAAATALRDVRPDQAARFAHLAVLRVVRTVKGFHNNDDWTLAAREAVRETVGALADAGAVDQTRNLMTYLRQKGWGGEVWGMWMAIALAEARAGHVEETWEALKRGYGCNAEAAFGPGVRTMSALAAALGTAGVMRRFESAARTAADRDPRLAAEALVAVAECLVKRDEDRVTELLNEAERLAMRSDRRHRLVWYEETKESRDLWLVPFAGALGTTGRLADVERLMKVVSEPEGRTWALAAASMGHHSTDGLQALRLAEAAANGVAEFHDYHSTLCTSAITAAAQALARAGAADRAVNLVERIDDIVDDFDEGMTLDIRVTALTAVATELWERNSTTATELIDTLAERVSANNTLYRLVSLAQLLVAAGHHDPRLRHRLVTTLYDGHARGPSVEDQVVASLLAIGTEPADARRLLTAAADKLREDKYRFDGEERGAIAIAHAALGDHEAATKVTDALDTDREGAAVLSIIAAYLAGLRGDPMATLFAYSPAPQHLRAIQQLATLVAPQPPDGDGLTRARRLLGRALMGDGWYYTMATIAELAPEAVVCVRDVVFAHLGLDEDQCLSCGSASEESHSA
ncbi:trypsin-like peptidase domain-containing protein [Streptomyces sp. WAC01526]|uniref:trypsin-like peptidase domain-containing protein n=1 Tax=Streptomyces sp. WAC01526 TaxID=2588709 RepID=UPI0011E00524|nr:trypsin-like peptidase domain-containing protein [Streptomyces sp. WAC01526]